MVIQSWTAAAITISTFLWACQVSKVLQDHKALQARQDRKALPVYPMSPALLVR